MKSAAWDDDGERQIKSMLASVKRLVREDIAAETGDAPPVLELFPSDWSLERRLAAARARRAAIMAPPTRLDQDPAPDAAGVERRAREIREAQRFEQDLAEASVDFDALADALMSGAQLLGEDPTDESAPGDESAAAARAEAGHDADWDDLSDLIAKAERLLGDEQREDALGGGSSKVPSAEAARAGGAETRLSSAELGASFDLVRMMQSLAGKTTVDFAAEERAGSAFDAVDAAERTPEEVSPAETSPELAAAEGASEPSEPERAVDQERFEPPENVETVETYVDALRDKAAAFDDGEATPGETDSREMSDMQVQPPSYAIGPEMRQLIESTELPQGSTEIDQPFSDPDASAAERESAEPAFDQAKAPAELDIAAGMDDAPSDEGEAVQKPSYVREPLAPESFVSAPQIAAGETARDEAEAAAHQTAAHVTASTENAADKPERGHTAPPEAKTVAAASAPVRPWERAPVEEIFTLPPTLAQKDTLQAIRDLVRRRRDHLEASGFEPGKLEKPPMKEIEEKVGRYRPAGEITPPAKKAVTAPEDLSPRQSAREALMGGLSDGYTPAPIDDPAPQQTAQPRDAAAGGARRPVTAPAIDTSADASADAGEARAVLAAWLEANLPRLVEEMVRQEVGRQDEEPDETSATGPQSGGASE